MSEPVLITGALVAVVNIVVILLKLDPALAAAITSAVVAVGAVFTRSKVSPTP